MKAALALLGAIAMVVVAVVVRSSVIDGDSGDRPAPVRLVCAEEFAAECRAVPNAAVRIEAAGTTADALAVGDPPADVDAWVVTAPWPELVDDRRRAAGLDSLFDPGPPAVAASPLGLVLRRERAPVLASQCTTTPDAIGWRCVGDNAGKPWSTIGGDPRWGDVRPGIDDPPRSAIGLLVASDALAARVGTIDFGRDVFDDPEISAWFTRLARSVPPAAGTTTPLERFLAVPATYDAVGDASGVITTALASADVARQGEFGVPAAPGAARAVVVVAGLAGRHRAAATAVAALRRGSPAATFGAAGWSVVKDSDPGPTGLPDGGTMQVVRERWLEALR